MTHFVDAVVATVKLLRVSKCTAPDAQNAQNLENLKALEAFLKGFWKGCVTVSTPREQQRACANSVVDLVCDQPKDPASFTHSSPPHADSKP